MAVRFDWGGVWSTPRRAATRGRRRNDESDAVGEAVDGLRAQFSGEVVGPDDAGYDAARAVHNGLIDKRPALIARCANTADVVDAVRFARAEGLEISARGGGHSVAGKAVTEGGVMVDLAPMRGSYVDPARRRARVQGGATWNDYNRVTHQHGLATTGGVISTTGVAGLTLGGGVGWLMSRFGMAVDNLDVGRARHRRR